MLAIAATATVTQVVRRARPQRPQLRFTFVAGHFAGLEQANESLRDALGDYLHGRSDLDVAAVTHATNALSTREGVVTALRHESLPCPARGLEFVLYPLAAVRAPSVQPGFDLNLNTGARMEFRVDYEPDPEEAHWFAIDRAILAEHGVALLGPVPRDVFAPLPRNLLLPLLVTSLRWHSRGAARGDDAVLNACRTLRYAAEARWSPKPEAGAWALGRVGDAELVEEALAARRGAPALDRERVAAFLSSVVAEVERAV
jgi:hypothetical protein